MQRGSEEVDMLEDDYDFWRTEMFERAGFPKMYFVEKRYAGDPTNWWIPNRACVEAMLRSAGFQILAHPETEVFACKYVPLPDAPRAIYASIRRDDYD
jgi:tRNA (mo5U34)-methyltransferase